MPDLDPFWHTRSMRRESLLFVAADGGGAAEARLLFRPVGAVTLATCDGVTTFVEGRDFVVDPGHRRLVLAPDSGVPFATHARLQPTPPAGDGFMHARGTPAQGLLWAEDDTFHRLQVAASYAHDETWTDAVPVCGGADLPGTMARLDAGAPLTLAITGDSISEGYNASAFVGVPPWQPPYPALVASALQQRYGSAITLRNLAVAGTTSSDGWGVAADVASTAPHLVIVAFGMNDAGYMDPSEYLTNIRHIVETIRGRVPAAEFVLVSPMLPHPDWHYPVLERFTAYRDALASVCGPGIVLADVTNLWRHVLTRKRYHDLTGNGINHPNDFGHRLYAQAVLAHLVP